MVPKKSFHAETLFYSVFHKTFDKRFPEFAMNLAISLRICQSNRELQNEVVNFMLNFVGKLRIAIWCSWFDNITTRMNLNKVKKIFLNQAMLIVRCLVLKMKMYTKLFEKYRRTPHHRRMARLAFC